VISLAGILKYAKYHYWSSQNPHQTQEAQLHPVKVGVWCAVIARIVGPVFLMTQLIAKIYNSNPRMGELK
jgi:hypothetical protein